MIREINKILEKRIRNEAKEILKNAPPEMNMKNDIPKKLITVEKDGKLIEHYIETDNMNYVGYRYEEGKESVVADILKDLSPLCEEDSEEIIEHNIKMCVRDSKNLQKKEEAYLKITFVPFLESD